MSSRLSEDGITKRLDAIIRLLLDEQYSAGKIKKKDQILALDSVGLSSGEIGRIIEWPSSDVASKLSKLKKGSKKK